LFLREVLGSVDAAFLHSGDCTASRDDARCCPHVQQCHGNWVRGSTDFERCAPGSARG
jgi:hypothetical protein